MPSACGASASSARRSASTADSGRLLAARYYWASFQGRLAGFLAGAPGAGLPLAPIAEATA